MEGNCPLHDHSIHVWCTYLRLVDFYGKERYVNITVPWMLWLLWVRKTRQHSIRLFRLLSPGGNFTKALEGAPEKWCLKDDPFVFGFRPIFRGKLVVKFPGCTLHCTSSSTSPEQTTKPCGLLKDLWTSGLEGYRKPKSGLVEGLEELGGFLVQSGPRNDRYKWSSGFCSRIISSPKQGECLGQQSTWWFFGTHYFVGDDIDTSFEVFCRCWGMM